MKVWDTDIKNKLKTTFDDSEISLYSKNTPYYKKINKSTLNTDKLSDKTTNKSSLIISSTELSSSDFNNLSSFSDSKYLNY